MNDKVRSLPRFKAGDKANLLEETFYENGLPVATDGNYRRVVDRVVIRERVDLKSHWGYRIEGHPGIHEEEYLEPLQEGMDGSHTLEAVVCKVLDFKDLLAQTYAFAMGEIVQIGDIDEGDEEIPLAYQYAMVTGIGYDEQGVTYYLGMWDGTSTFLDTQYEFIESDLMKITEADKLTLLSATEPRPRLKLAVSNQNPTGV